MATSTFPTVVTSPITLPTNFITTKATLSKDKSSTTPATATTSVSPVSLEIDLEKVLSPIFTTFTTPKIQAFTLSPKFATPKSQTSTSAPSTTTTTDISLESETIKNVKFLNLTNTNFNKTLLTSKHSSAGRKKEIKPRKRVCFSLKREMNITNTYEFPWKPIPNNMTFPGVETQNFTEYTKWMSSHMGPFYQAITHYLPLPKVDRSKIKPNIEISLEYWGLLCRLSRFTTKHKSVQAYEMPHVILYGASNPVFSYYGAQENCAKTFRKIKESRKIKKLKKHRKGAQKKEAKKLKNGASLTCVFLLLLVGCALLFTV